MDISQRDDERCLHLKLYVLSFEEAGVVHREQVLSPEQLCKTSYETL